MAKGTRMAHLADYVRQCEETTK
jgi:hypothetical protein